jgi:hypothetical protein
MEMPGRKWTASNYRYSHNGQEREAEVFDGANSAVYWMYDARIGRRWNLDPKPTIGLSDYACFANNPILNVDINGDKVHIHGFKTFVKVMSKAIVDKNFRKQLIAQHKATRSTTQVVKNADGSTREGEVTHKQHFHYKYEKNSENSLQGAADNADAEMSQRAADNKHSSVNSYDVEFSNKKETMMSWGASPNLINRMQNFPIGNPKTMTSNQVYKNGTIVINFAAGNNDTGDDRIRIYSGSTLIRDIKMPETNPLVPNDPNMLRNFEFPFKNNRYTKIRVVISSDNTLSSDPGAYHIKMTIKRD